ncbi:MAG: glycosyltransferase [Peptostreptococcaceae bacterium]|nr:glycosyltransferase [Peptostreptococcaceae bacterium]
MKNLSSNMNNFNISIIIPTYNASGSLQLLVKSIERSLVNFNLSIILIDDCSKDNTPAIIKSLSKEYDNIAYLFSSTNKGQQASLHAGLKLVTQPCDFVVTMDDDLQNPVEEILKLINEIQLGYDMVYAIPSLEGNETHKQQPVMRKIGSHMRNLFFDRFINKPAGIKVSAFRIMTYELAVKIASSQRRYFYLSAEAFQYQIKVSNIFYPFVPRNCGKTSYNFTRLLAVYLRLFSTYKLGLFKQVKK